MVRINVKRRIKKVYKLQVDCAIRVGWPIRWWVDEVKDIYLGGSQNIWETVTVRVIRINSECLFEEQ